MEQRFGFGGEVFVVDGVALLVENAEMERSCVQVDAGVEFVLLHVVSHRGLRVRECAGCWLLPVYLARRGHDEYPNAAADGPRQRWLLELQRPSRVSRLASCLISRTD